MGWAIILIVLGLTGPIASIQWRRDEWLPAGRWVVRTLSPHAVAGLPMIGLVICMIGLSIIWPPAVVLAFIGAVAFVAVLVASVNGGWVGRLPRSLRPRQRADRPQQRIEQATERRRAG
jgi:Ca2+/Na+ antiporter